MLREGVGIQIVRRIDATTGIVIDKPRSAHIVVLLEDLILDARFL